MSHDKSFVMKNVSSLLSFLSIYALLTRGQLTDPSLGTHLSHNNLRDNGGHTLMITGQITTKVGPLLLQSGQINLKAAL